MHSPLQQVKERIDLLLRQKDRIIVAIDGNCAAGKTTLAAQLAETFECNIFHMDDFFLRPCQRTPERFAETGGNVDYERFRQEVLLPLIAGEVFSYRPFDCSTMELSDPVLVAPKKLNIIEGSYSLHPYFEDPYDLRVFLRAAPALQHARILQRPAFLHRRFFEEWIPMEQRYFDGFEIPANCHLCIEAPETRV